MTEVTRHQILDAVGHGNDDVRGIRRSFARNRPEFKKPAREILRFRGCVQERNAFKRVQSVARRSPVARPALCENELRHHQMESPSGILHHSRVTS